MADLIVNLESVNSEELVSQGIKAFNLGDFNTAVTALSRAVELMVAEHGDKHDSLGSAYFYYGKALLEVYREEIQPLGDVVPQEINSDSGEDTPTTTKEILNEKQSVPNNATTDTADNSPEKVPNVSKPDDKKVDAEIITNGQGKDEHASTSETQDLPTNEETVEEEPTDLQVAWEVLELAKIIYENRGESGKKELAETFILLGEVSLESDNFASAIDDIKCGLEIQKTMVEDDSRTLAETYYKLAVALSTNNQIDDAIEHFNKSLSILKNRVNRLKENSEANNDEIKDIEGLIPEIEEKIADMRSFKEETAQNLIAAMKSKPETNNLVSSDASSSSVVNDISHLIKRKRKADDEIGEEKATKRVSE